ANPAGTACVVRDFHLVPEMDNGSAESGPGRRLKSVWVTLSPEEAHELHTALDVWAEDVAAGESDPQWHTHITGRDGNELTIAIARTDQEELARRRPFPMTLDGSGPARVGETIAGPTPLPLVGGRIEQCLLDTALT